MTAGQWQQVWCSLDVFTQTDGRAVQSQSPPFSLFCPFFVESTGPRPPPTWDVIFFLNRRSLCSPSLNQHLPTRSESDRALRSSWRRSLFPVWSRARPSPSCPKSYLSVCLSSPAVVPASHLGVKSPSVMEDFDAMGIYKINQKHREPQTKTPCAEWLGTNMT